MTKEGELSIHMHYDPEANILSWEVSQGEITNTREFGNFIIHLSPLGKPILIEILEASSFIGQFSKLKNIKNIGKITRDTPVGINLNKLN